MSKPKLTQSCTAEEEEKTDRDKKKRISKRGIELVFFGGGIFPLKRQK